MLTLPRLRAMALRAQPTFLESTDYVEARPASKKIEGAASVRRTAPEGSVTAPEGSVAAPERSSEQERRLIGSRALVPRRGDDDGCVCWVSSAGCLTPLHYDLDHGLLAQVLTTYYLILTTYYLLLTTDY